MPSPFTPSFASAAAGNPSSDGSINSRNFSGGDWSRNRTNGATQTFRRPSTTSSNLASQREGSQSSTNPPSSASSVYVPPHIISNYQTPYSRNGSSGDTRYSKEQLLDMFRMQEKGGYQGTNIHDLFIDGWNPGAANGIESTGWGRKDDNRDTSGPEICWDHEGTVQPLALTIMTDEEREIFMTSVNSSLKPAPNATKDGTPRDGINRRTSMTQSQIPTNSPSTRPGGRRRDSTDLLRDPLSPSNNRFSKEESGISSPPPSLLRRKTDFKESFPLSTEQKEPEGSKPNVESSPFGTLKRTQTGPAGATLNGPSSPWSQAPQSAGFSPMGAFGNFAAIDPASEKRAGFGSVRGESRFKGLMNASSSENIGSGIREKTSQSNIGQLGEAASDKSVSKWETGRSQPQSHHADDSREEIDLPAGSAALGGDDASPPMPQSSRYRNPDQQVSYEDIGFSSVGMSAEVPPFRELMQRRDFSHQQTPQRHQGIGQMNEPMSPTDTNPYQSPEGEKAIPNDIDQDDSDFPGAHFQGGAGFGQPARNLQSQFDSHDRNQTSSAGASRTFGGLGGLGSLSGLGGGSPWSAAPGAIGTPSRAHPAHTPGFGDSTFGNFGGLNSPGQGGFTGAGASFFGSGAHTLTNNAGVGRGSKLGSLFPSSMHDDSANETQRQDQIYKDGGDVFPRNTQAFGPLGRDTDSPHLRSSHMDDMPGNEKRLPGPQGFVSTVEKDPIQAPSSVTVAQTPFVNAQSSASFFPRQQDQELNSASNQLPASQQRQMVMPDRMRWIYRDPQGNTQGPWSGLEMHDWYKAGFFSPELQVKKLEDSDYEPLAQLIRRIGNSREPFLVPQIGIPHGSATTTTGQNAPGAGAPSGAAQPPFASSFPSFGTTLTAEQQNALERRKQEEQYLMARQKEYLAQQQNLLKQMQHMQGNMHGGQLHHQSSGHSLHSQPSFGSITSPAAYQPTPGTGPVQPPAPMHGFFDGPPRNAGPLGADALGSVREDDLPGYMDRLNVARTSQIPFFTPHGQEHPQQVNAMLQDRARLAKEQEQFDRLQRENEDPRSSAERLEQYQQLRNQEGDVQFQQPGTIGARLSRQIGPQQSNQAQEQQDEPHQPTSDQRAPEQLSLSEQVQKAAAKKPSATPAQSPWGQSDTGLPQPLPPPQSTSPMPAPTPQRNRQSVADALNAESQSPSQTDSVETPSATIAPWAKESSEAAKGPSLKEIQAMEAQKAAQREEIQAAARRAVAEQERINQQNQAATAASASAPGLPSSANWASSVPPAVPTTSSVSPWAKTNLGKPTVATPVTGTKKTLAQIQKEEEARKNRAAAAAATANAATNNASVASAAGGKRYADLASKGGQPPLNTSNAAWTTVGAGGKAKTPTVPAPSQPSRTASSTIPSSAAPIVKSKPTVLNSTKSSQQTAFEELQRWTKNALSKGLDSKIPIDGFVASLLDLPAEADIISDSIYANSTTLDGRRFAEEFLRRRKLADRGIVPDPSPSGAAASFSSASTGGEGKSGTGGGWSEVAKKGGQTSTSALAGSKDDPTGAGAGAQFKVVSGKKKVGKR